MLRAAIAAAVLALPLSAWPQDDDARRIEEAVLPLAPALRAGATVVAGAGADRRVLREGTNPLICQADGPSPFFSVACWHRDLDRLLVRSGELEAQGRTEDEVRDQLSQEIRAGELPAHPAGVAEYRLFGPSVAGALGITVVFLPNATARSTGLSAEPSSYRPWLMWAGTPVAHVMLPGQ